MPRKCPPSRSVAWMARKAASRAAVSGSTKLLTATATSTCSANSARSVRSRLRNSRLRQSPTAFAGAVQHSLGEIDGEDVSEMFGQKRQQGADAAAEVGDCLRLIRQRRQGLRSGLRTSGRYGSMKASSYPRRPGSNVCLLGHAETYCPYDEFWRSREWGLPLASWLLFRSQEESAILIIVTGERTRPSIR